MSRRDPRFWFRRVARTGAIACLLALGCSASDGPNVLLYVVDTLRVDDLGCYGGEGARTPNFDALAADGILFENAFASSSWTRPSMASIMTGLHPPRHLAETLMGSISPDVPTLY